MAWNVGLYVDEKSLFWQANKVFHKIDFKEFSKAC